MTDDLRPQPPSQGSVPDAECVHLPDYAGETCAGCGEEIDRYGNTPDDFRFCSFPDCGCDGARLCMAGEASAAAGEYNVEGMYQLRDPRPRLRFLGAVYSGEFNASGIEGEAGDPQGLHPEGESPVAEGETPKDKDHD